MQIDLGHIKEELLLFIDARRENTLFDVADSQAHLEARYQIVEGQTYDYSFNNAEVRLLDDSSQIVQPHARYSHLGTIAPNIFVGTLRLYIGLKDKEIGFVELEVRSLKAEYRNDYRDMLGDITEKCTELLLQAESPVSQNLQIDFTKDSQTLYQRFAFVKSIVHTEEFDDSLHRIISRPATKWEADEDEIDARRGKRWTSRNIKEVAKSNMRAEVSSQNLLGLPSVPARISVLRKTDSVDTPENRFVKHALTTLSNFCSDIAAVSEKGSRLFSEASYLNEHLSQFLSHSIFKEIREPETLRLNSPVLQRKEGYREVLRVWLMFDLAAKLIWEGGNDVYQGGKKDIATLYEYWIFFKLLELIETFFNIPKAEINQLLNQTEKNLGLSLKQGSHTALRGTYESSKRKLNIKFNYNRAFSNASYPEAGSWSLKMRPDYTLSIWPFGLSEEVAETEELIVHIHFDAKYKVANLNDLIGQLDRDELDLQKEENKQGIYKNADILKMHAYRDAIRRTGGSYVLYPGSNSIALRGFHEILPGLGAFPIRPGKRDSGLNELKEFLKRVVEHLQSKISQREKLSYHIYTIFKNKPSTTTLSLPREIEGDRSFHPDDIGVLMAPVESTEHLQWINVAKKFNLAVKLDFSLRQEIFTSRMLLLYSKQDVNALGFYLIVNDEIKVSSKSDLENVNYSPLYDQYFVFDLQSIEDTALVSELTFEYVKRQIADGKAFAVKLRDLLPKEER